MPRFSLSALATIVAATLPLACSAPPARDHAMLANGGVVAEAFEHQDDRSSARRALVKHAAGTYIDEILAERDSALSRWPDDLDGPLVVWIQPAPAVAGWNSEYVSDVQDAFNAWTDVALPVAFTFTTDSSSADVHVTFVHHFEEQISGRTRWSRDDNWHITAADISLATYHRNGPRLDDDAMRAMTMHEVGHLLGLDHTDDPGSIMAARVRVRSLSRADRATARLLYSLPAGAIR